MSQHSKLIPKHYIDGFGEMVNLTGDFRFAVRIKKSNKRIFTKRMRNKIFKAKIDLEQEMI